METPEERRYADRRDYERGQRAATIDGRLQAHEDRLLMIDGAFRDVQLTLDKLQAAVADLAEAGRRESAVNQAVADFLHERQAQQVTSRQLLYMMIGLFIALAAVIVPLVALIAGGH